MRDLFSKDAVIFSAKACIAALAAFYIALELNFEKPAWSLTSVYVVSQYYSASTVSKSLYRFLGTLLGGIFIFLIYPLTVNSPVLFSLCVSLWVAFCLYFSLRDRKPSNYIFMLGGYSAAIIGFPDVSTPEMITWTVISRIEEITVAIICSSLIHSIILPASMRNILSSGLERWSDTIHKLCLKVIKEPCHSTGRADYASLITNPTTLENVIAHCEFDGVMSKGRIQIAYTKVRNLTLYLPVIAALQKRLEQLKVTENALPSYAQKFIDQFTAWLYVQDKRRIFIENELDIVQEENRKMFKNGDESLEKSLLIRGVFERIGNFLDLAAGSELLHHRANFAYKPAENKFSNKKIWHIDSGLLNLSCLTAFIATFAACLFWAGSGWKDGGSAPMIAAIMCSFYATLDKPTILMKTFLKGTLISATISIIYISLIMPMAVNIESLFISLTPLLFILGLIIARPATNIIGIVITAQIPAFISMGHHFRPDLLLIINEAISMVVGIFFAAVVTSIIRNRSPQWTARRAYRKGVYDLVAFNERIRLNQVSEIELEQFWRRSLDKSSVIFPRLAGHNENFLGEILVSESWIAENLHKLCREQGSSLAKHEISVDVLIVLLNRYLLATTSGKLLSESAELLNYLDEMMLKCEEILHKDEGLFDALFYIHSIRITIFPKEKWPQKMEPSC